METDTQWLRENALPKCDERCFLHSHIVCEGAYTSSEDMLTQPKDCSGHGSISLGEFLKGIAHLESFLEVTFLVHVNGLYKLSTGENHGVILILGLSFSQDGVAWQTDTVKLLDLSIAVTLDKTRVESHLTRTLVAYIINVGNTHVREAVHEVVNIIGLGILVLLHLTIDLTRHDISKLLAHQIIGRIIIESFKIGKQTKGLFEVHHSSDGPVQGLTADASPLPRLGRTLLGPDLILINSLAFQEVGPIGLEQSLQIEHGRNSKSIISCLQFSLVESHSLLVVGSQHIPREHVMN
mmetsp:Transcript_42244/g.76222  ORF Transcript_42244/g.76222 Transcript_42244/m.76222 type:complete len:295 (-) Transcript_42244:3328-4212(-)